MDKFQFYFELIVFISLVTVYIFIATRKQTKWTKIGEVAVLYSTTLFFQFSKTISTLIFILTILFIILFNVKLAKRNERRTERLGG